MIQIRVDPDNFGKLDPDPSASKSNAEAVEARARVMEGHGLNRFIYISTSYDFWGKILFCKFITVVAYVEWLGGGGGGGADKSRLKQFY